MEAYSSVNSTPVERPRKTLGQIWRFVVIGFMNMFIDLAVLNLLIWISGTGRTGIWYSVFKAMSFTIAVVNSYYFNRRWVFRGLEGKKVAIEFSKFIIVSIIGAFVNVGAASLVANFQAPLTSFFQAIPGIKQLFDWGVALLGRITTDAWATVGGLFGSAAGLIWNFVGYKFLVFIKKSKT